MRYLLFTVLLLNSILGLSQQKLSGFVYSAKDSTAIADVSIYFDGTTLGTITNINGHYAINIQPGVKSALVISMLGYEPVYITDYSNQTRELRPVYLKESTEQLDEVFLETDPWSKERKLSEFKREFLGKTLEAQDVKILNENAVKLHYSPSKNRLVAWASVPLRIENKYLGYIIEYQLGEFYAQYEKSLSSGFNMVYMVYYEGTSFFSELKKDKIPRRFMKHRDEAFEGSTLHFMRSLAQRKLRENKFRIFYKSMETPHYKYFDLQKGEENMHVTITAEKLSILYNNQQQSELTAKRSFQVDKFGNHTPPSAIIIGGAMSTKRIATMLPLNYKL